MKIKLLGSLFVMIVSLFLSGCGTMTRQTVTINEKGGNKKIYVDALVIRGNVHATSRVVIDVTNLMPEGYLIDFRMGSRTLEEGIKPGQTTRFLAPGATYSNDEEHFSAILYHNGPEGRKIVSVYEDIIPLYRPSITTFQALNGQLTSQRRILYDNYY